MRDCSGDFGLSDDGWLIIDTIEWLARNGYVSYGERNVYAFLRATLTEKGLEVLNRVPESLSTDSPEQKQSWGQRLSAALAKGGSTAISVVAKQLLTEGVKISMQAAMVHTG